MSSPSCASATALLRLHHHIFDEEYRQGASLKTRILMNVTQIRLLVGAPSHTLQQIMSLSGASVSILSVDDLPDCALANDRVCQIQGNPVQTRACLRLILRQLRDSPPQVQYTRAFSCMVFLFKKKSKKSHPGIAMYDTKDK